MHKNARTSLTKKVSGSASYRLRSDFFLTLFFKTIRYCKTIVLRKRNVMLFLTTTVPTCPWTMLLGPAAKLLGPEAKLLGPAINLLGPAAKLLGPAAKLMGPEAKLMGPEAKLMWPEAKLLGPDAKLLGPTAKLMGPEAKLLGPATKVLGLENKLLGPEAKRERLLSMCATVSGLHLCLFLRQCWHTKSPIRIERDRLLAISSAVETRR